MIIAPNTYRAGVVGGFVIEPPALSLSASFTPNSTWIDVGIGAGGWLPEVGEEIEFVIDDSFSGMPMIVGAAFSWRGPWAQNTAYAVNDVLVWFDAGGAVVAWLVIAAFNSGPAFSFSPIVGGIAVLQQMNFTGAYVSGTAYTAGDLVLAPDTGGHMQTWVALSSFTSSGPFVQGFQWGGCLAATTIFYVVAVNDGQIEISTSPTGAPVLFVSGGFFLTPNTVPELTAYFGASGFGAGSGLTPALSVGALFAQGTAWIPGTPPSVPAAPTNQFSYLGYNDNLGIGLYWTTNPLGNTAGDAVLGWVSTNATDIIAASFQNVETEGAGGEVGAVPGAIPFLSTTTPPTPICGIAGAGSGEVTWDAITFAGGVDTSQVNSAVIVVLYQDATAGVTAHLTAALTNTAMSGDAATLSTDTNLTGIVFAGDWLLIGGEMMFVTADASSSTVAVERALGLTTAENHSIGDDIYLLVQATFSYSFPLGFFESVNAASWGPTEQLPNANIALFNVVVFNAVGGESAEAPINYSQSMGGLIDTGAPPSGSSGFLPHAVAGVVAGLAQLNFGLARAMAVTLTADTTIAPINTSGLDPFLWVLSVYQDNVGGHSMIPGGSGLTAALSSAQSPANTFVTGLFLFDGAGNHVLLCSTGDQPIP